MGNLQEASTDQLFFMLRRFNGWNHLWTNKIKAELFRRKAL